jgi:GNAT superfamily N-acetyltransferase
MGSLSKALGSFGGFIAASQDTVDYLRFFAKAISFAVGLPGSHAAAARQSLAIIRESPERIEQLRCKARLFRDALIAEGFAECAVSESAIMSIEISDEMLLRDMVRELFEREIWAEGLPFPAVARGQERVRFRVRWDHADDDLLRAAGIVGEVHRRVVGRAHGSRSSHSFHDGFDEQIVTHLAPQQLEDLCDACIRQAQQHKLALAWISREFIAKYFARSSYWSELASERTWHLGYRSGQLATAFQVDRTTVACGGRSVRAAMVGSIVCQPGCEAELQRQMLEAARRLPTDVECCVAPAAHPVQVFGCGLQSWQALGGKPFLETSYPEEFLGASGGEAFPSRGTKRYWRVELPCAPPSLEKCPQVKAADDIVVRDFRRPEFVAEIDRIAPILDRTIGQLELCAPVPRSVLEGLVQDLRELVLPGFWLVAEYGDRTIGFAFCYPNLTAEFERIRGRADVADFQRVQQAMETTREAFLAWMAVDPDFAEQGVGARLLNELRSRLVARGYTHAWVSWELVDGALPAQQLAEVLGTIVQTAEMPYFGVPLSRGPAPIVPEPHFSKCESDIYLRDSR